jgi:uncharacterized membrane protein
MGQACRAFASVAREDHNGAVSNEGDAEAEQPSSDADTDAPGLRDRLQRLERIVDPGVKLVRGAGDRVIVPAWRQVTEGESRWPVSIAVIVAIVTQAALPSSVAVPPRWLLPALATLLLVGLIVSNPRKIDRLSPALRALSMVLIALISLANAVSAGRLVVGLVRGTIGKSAATLLLTGAAIWLINVIVFALWYWDLDRGGPAARAVAPRPYPDFLFVQMQNPELAPTDWEPRFVDYLYLSFTNATAFSPTDVMPMSRWAKLTMMLQSIVSLVTVALVIARAVNILK